MPLRNQANHSLKEEKQRYGFKKNEDHGRQHGDRIRLVCVHRCGRHLSHHAVVRHGGRNGQDVRCEQEKPVRQTRSHHRNAVGGRRFRRRARLPRGRRPDHDLHRLAGPAADDPEHVQNRGRISAGRDARLGALALHTGAVHLRRPFRHLRLPPDRLCDAVLQQPAGVHGPGRRRPPRRHQGQHAGHAFLRRLPHFPRDPENPHLGL